MDLSDLTYVYGMAVGYAVAGLVMSGFHLVTGQPLGFALSGKSGVAAAPLEILLRLVAGPTILVRNSLSVQGVAGPAWLFLGVTIASFWSLCSGILLVQSFEQLGMF
jgi:hypothetical protein